MQTRRLLDRLTSTSLLLGLGFASLLVLAPACDKGDDGDDEAAEGDGDGDSADTNATDSADSNATNDSADTNADTGSAACDDACAALEACGLPSNECLGVCTSDACAQCLLASASCGADCLDACSGSSDTTTGNDTSDSTTDTGNQVPPTECVMNSECGLGYECVACGLTDNEGWCEQTSACTFDDDCGIDGKCGYNVETADYRCLPAAYCG